VGDVHDKAMTYISYIGCAVSIFGLAVTIITYSMFRFVYFYYNKSDVRHQKHKAVIKYVLYAFEFI
jgi:hypothetical protein